MRIPLCLSVIRSSGEKKAPLDRTRASGTRANTSRRKSLNAQSTSRHPPPKSRRMSRLYTHATKRRRTGGSLVDDRTHVRFFVQGGKEERQAREPCGHRGESVPRRSRSGSVVLSV